jgi:hypothetical protein
MKAMFDKGKLKNIVPSNYKAGNKIYDDTMQEITSIEEGITLCTGSALDQYGNEKYKIVDGHLSYTDNYEAVLLESENEAIINKRQEAYKKEVDGLTLEAIRIGVNTANGKELIKQANAKVKEIKEKLQKKESKNK